MCVPEHQATKSCAPSEGVSMLGIFHLWWTYCPFLCRKTTRRAPLISEWMTIDKAKPTRSSIDLNLPKVFDQAWSGRWPALWTTSLSDEFLKRWFPSYNSRTLDNAVRFFVTCGPIPHHTSQALWDKAAFWVVSRRLFCDVVEFALDNGGMPLESLDKLASIWRMGPHFVWLTLSKWHSDFWRFLPAHVTDARRFIGDTFGAGSRFAVWCGEDRGANQSWATTSNSCNGWPPAAYNLGAGGWCCMLAAAGSQSQHLFGISSVKHHDVEANCLIWLDRSVSLSENYKYSNSIQFCGFTCRVFRQWKWSNLQLTSFLWMFVFPQPSVVQTVLLAARRNMVLPSWTWNIGMSWLDAHGCGPACGHFPETPRSLIF